MGEVITNQNKLLNSSQKTNLTIASVGAASSAEWDLIWRECEYSTYFHSREWAEIWSLYSKRKMFSTPFLVMFSDGKRALLPFSCLTQEGLKPILTGTRRLYVSSPECTYGGWISTDRLVEKSFDLAAKSIQKEI